jgi:hypothetical protein
MGADARTVHDAQMLTVHLARLSDDRWQRIYYLDHILFHRCA